MTEFVSFDLEMTGITGDKELRDDLTFERYSKIKKVAMKYNII